MTASSPLDICILTSQYFAWGKYGGFGSMSRKLAEGLARIGHRVSVIVPRRQDQKAVETVNGVEIHSFSGLSMRGAGALIRASRAQIFHSQDPTFLTLLAQRLRPDAKHVVTCRDPRDARDWWIEFRYATPRRRLWTPFNYLTESSFLIKKAVRDAHRVYCPAHFLKPKIKRMFGLQNEPHFMPNLIDVPDAIPTKPKQPTITFVARWDVRKRPWMFLEMARHFPEYRFIAAGKGEDPDYDQALRAKYAGVPNLEMPGFVDRFSNGPLMHSILSDTWVFANTAAREGLPLTFLEAAAYGSAILSAVDPDNFASQFGRQVTDDDFVGGLRKLLNDNALARGRAAYAYVRANYENEQALRTHVAAYHQCLQTA